MSDEDYTWVHEKDYGAPEFGGVIVGFVELIVGIFGLIAYLFRGRDE